jgi:mRNA-degrading endonuclease HigB of HigAB toxin-antitoxin module
MVCLLLFGCVSRVEPADWKVGGDLSLGESFDTLLKEDNRYLLDAVGNAVKLVSIVFPHLRR